MPQLRDPLCYQLAAICAAGFAYELRTPQHGAPNEVQVVTEFAVMNTPSDLTIADVGIYDGRAILWTDTQPLLLAGHWVRLHGEWTLLTDQVLVIRWRPETYAGEPVDIEGDWIHANVFGYVAERYTTP